MGVVTLEENIARLKDTYKQTYINHLQTILDGQSPLFPHDQRSEFVRDYDTQHKAVLKRLKENQDRLYQCPHHAFDKKVDDYVSGSSYFLKKWECAHCKGLVSYEQKDWYTAGFAHGQRSANK